MRLIKYDRLFDDSYSELERWFDRNLSELRGRPSLFAPSAARSFKVDLWTDDDNHYVVAELPGVNKKDIDIELENAVLTISGSQKTKAGEGEKEFTFSRSITVGDDIANNRVSAKMDNGLLTITLPKVEEKKPQLIKIT